MADVGGFFNDFCCVFFMLPPEAAILTRLAIEFLRGDCVQVVCKKAALKGLKMDLSNAESTTDS
jgi:hypothetical protein